MVKMIGLAKEDSGLYLLEDTNRMRSTKSQIPLSLLLETTLYDQEEICLLIYTLDWLSH